MPYVTHYIFDPDGGASKVCEHLEVLWDGRIVKQIGIGMSLYYVNYKILFLSQIWV